MADIPAPTGIVNTQQVVEVDSFRIRQLQELEVLRLLEMEYNTLDPTRGYEIR